MSLSLATRGIICTAAAPGGGGGSYPVYIYVYVPVEEPTVGTEEVGSIDIHRTSLDIDIRGKVMEPEISPRELKPKMKAD